MFKKLFFFILITNCFLLITKNVYAKDFSSFNKVTYEFLAGGEAVVNQEISLVNQVANLYVSEYSLSLMGGQISSVEAFDKIGPLKTDLVKKGETTILTFSFNDKVVGKDKVLSFIIKYRISDLAKKEGNIWQITIPKLVNSENLDDFSLLVKIPLSFGKISSISPKPIESKNENNFYLLTFDKESILDFGVIATFGQYQTLDFKINYSLTNDTDAAQIENITLPPDTDYQTVFYKNIDPGPLDVKIDDDGNWLAFYELLPNESLAIEVTGLVNLFSQPKKLNLTSVDSKNYLSSTQYWQADNEKMIALAKELKTAENIYRFVVNYLTYNYQAADSGFQRTGALKALENPKNSTCSQFTDLFIAIARSAGIPAREVVGYAQTNNQKIARAIEEQDLLHSWPEYYDSKLNSWVMVDPTWENTTSGVDFFNQFDMSHFAFVIHGKNDIFPLSPGSFRDNPAKQEIQKEKQIFVSFSEETLNDSVFDFFVNDGFRQETFSLKKNNFKLVFKRLGGMALYSQNLVSSDKNIYPSSWFFEVIPPFSEFEIDFFLRPQELLKDYESKLSFSLNNAKVQLPLKVKSLLLRSFVLLGAAISLLLIFLLRAVRKNSCKRKNNNAILDLEKNEITF